MKNCVDNVRVYLLSPSTNSATMRVFYCGWCSVKISIILGVCTYITILFKVTPQHWLCLRLKCITSNLSRVSTQNLLYMRCSDVIDNHSAILEVYLTQSKSELRGVYLTIHMPDTISRLVQFYTQQFASICSFQDAVLLQHSIPPTWRR